MTTPTDGDIDFATWQQIAGLPSAQPPDGVTPNFVDPNYHGQAVIALAAICLPWLVLMLAVRLFAKIRVTKKFTPDDYIYFISWPAGVALICLLLAIVTMGVYGYHGWDIQLKQLTTPLIIRLQTLQYLAGPFSWLYRLSLFSLIYYVFAPLRWVRVLVWVGVVVSLSVYMIPPITFAVICRPRGGHSHLDYLAGEGSAQCADSKALGFKINVISAAWSVVVDLYLLALPIPAIRGLQVSKKRRLGIYLVFGTAVIGCLTSVVVLVFRARLYGATDLTYKIIPIFAVSIVETTVALSIPCAASIAAIHQHYQTKRQVSANVPSRTARAFESTAELRRLDRQSESKQSWKTTSIGSESREMDYV